MEHIHGIKTTEASVLDAGAGKTIKTVSNQVLQEVDDFNRRLYEELTDVGHLAPNEPPNIGEVRELCRPFLDQIQHTRTVARAA